MGFDSFSQVFLQKLREAERRKDEARQYVLADRHYALTNFAKDSQDVWNALQADPDMVKSGDLLTFFEQYLVTHSLAPEIAQQVDTQIEADVVTLQRKLDSDHPLLIIAHSQGNLYANAAVRKVIESADAPTRAYIKTRLSVLGLAVPGRISSCSYP